MSKQAINKIFNEFFYASGPSQFILYGIWTIISSGLFPISGYLPALTLLWLLSGIVVIGATFTFNRKFIRFTILLSLTVASASGSMFFSYALTGGDMRADMQSVTVAVITLIIWGLYLGNLCTRQLLDKDKVKR